MVTRKKGKTGNKVKKVSPTNKKLVLSDIEKTIPSKNLSKQKYKIQRNTPKNDTTPTEKPQQEVLASAPAVANTGIEFQTTTPILPFSENPTRRILRTDDTCELLQKLLAITGKLNESCMKNDLNRILSDIQEFSTFIVGKIQESKYGNKSLLHILSLYNNDSKEEWQKFIQNGKAELVIIQMLGHYLSSMLDAGFCVSTQYISPSRTLLLNPQIPFGILRFCQRANISYHSHGFRTLTEVIVFFKRIISSTIKIVAQSTPMSIAGYSIGKFPRTKNHIAHDHESYNSRNQDRIFWKQTHDYRFTLMLVADGVTNSFLGSGDRAAEIVLQTTKDNFPEKIPENFGKKEVIDLITKICQESTNRIISEVVAQHREILVDDIPYIMAASVCLVGIIDQTAIAASLGDTRAYLVRPNTMAEVLTVDATPHVLSFLYPEYEAGFYDNSTLGMCVGHAKYTSTGVSAEHDPLQFRCIPLQIGDFIVICSDGVYSPIEKDNLLFEDILEHEIDSASKEAAPMAFTLLAQAMRENRDDASIIVSKFIAPEK